MPFSISDHKAESLKVEVYGGSKFFWIEFDNWPDGRTTLFVKSPQELINLKNKIHWAFEKWEKERD